MEVVFRGNPKIAKPNESLIAAQWVAHYSGARLYGNFVGNRLVINKAFRASRGEFYLSPQEMAYGEKHGGGVIIEPNVKYNRQNKQWPVDRYRLVAKHLLNAGYTVSQFDQSGRMAPLAKGVKLIYSHDIRYAAAVLAHSKLFIGPEGGLHHAAAAVNVPAVVIFGGYIHPCVTGYNDHTNIFVGDDGCGLIGQACPHCKSIMESITVEQVMDAVREKLFKVSDNETHRAQSNHQGQPLVVS